MPIVTITWVEGRNDDVKRKVAKGLTELLQKEAGAEPASISIIFEDLKKNNLAKAGVLFIDK